MYTHEEGTPTFLGIGCVRNCVTAMIVTLTSMILVAVLAFIIGVALGYAGGKDRGISVGRVQGWTEAEKAWSQALEWERRRSRDDSSFTDWKNQRTG